METSERQLVKGDIVWITFMAKEIIQRPVLSDYLYCFSRAEQTKNVVKSYGGDWLSWEDLNNISNILEMTL